VTCIALDNNDVLSIEEVSMLVLRSGLVLGFMYLAQSSHHMPTVLLIHINHLPDEPSLAIIVVGDDVDMARS
jgi:hypothetical protein